MRKLPLLGILGLFVLATIVTQLQLFASSVFAATQSFGVGGTNSSYDLTYDTDDNPVLNDDPGTTANFNGFSINNSPTSGNEQTNGDTNSNLIYTWRIGDLSDYVCSNAQLTSLRIVADVTADTEGDPDLAALMVYRIDGADQYNIGDYTVQQGTDYATSTGGFTPPGGDGIYGVVRGSNVGFGGQLSGSLEATWDMSSYGLDDQFGIMVQQDSQDGSVNLMTTIQTVELTYDDANCVYDGAIQKTLLNADSVKPGGQAVYEITVTNKGTEPLPFNAQEDRGIYDLPSKSLTYQSVESSDVDIECQDAGDLGTIFGGDPQLVLPYQNHLDYHLVQCASQSSALIPSGESWSYRLTFDVAPDATNITNFVSWVLVGNSWADPDMPALATVATSLTPGGQDMIDLLLSGALSADIVSVAVHDFTTSSNTDAQDETLAYTGGSVVGVGAAGVAVLLAGAFIFRNRHWSYRGI